MPTASASAHSQREPRRGAPLRVLLADRPGPPRVALAGALRGLPGVALVGTVGERTAVADALRRTRADVLVVDDRLLTAGQHLAAGLGPQRAGVRAIVLGVDDAPAFAARARRLGADAWVAKERAAEELPALFGAR